MNTYTDGDLVAVTVSFFDETEASVDPETVTLQYTIGSSPEVTLLWDGVTTTPAAGKIGKVSPGVYTAYLDTTELPGTWLVEGQATGAGQSASRPVKFLVNPGV